MPIRIDVEEPGRDPWTITLAEAISDYSLADYEIAKLEAGGVVWYHGDTALTLHEEEE